MDSFRCQVLLDGDDGDEGWAMTVTGVFIMMLLPCVLMCTTIQDMTNVAQMHWRQHLKTRKSQISMLCLR